MKLWVVIAALVGAVMSATIAGLLAALLHASGMAVMQTAGATFAGVLGMVGILYTILK